MRVKKLLRSVLLAGAALTIMLGGCTSDKADHDLTFEANSDLGSRIRIRQSVEQVGLHGLLPSETVHVNFEQFVSSLAPFVEYSVRSSTDSLDTKSSTSFEAWEATNQVLLAELEQWMHANILLEGVGHNTYLTELMHTLIFPPVGFEVVLIAKYGPDWPKEQFDSVFEAEYLKLATLWQEVNMDQQPPWLVFE